MQLELNYFSKSINNNVNISVYYPCIEKKSVNLVWLFPGLGANKNDIILNRQIQNAMKRHRNFVFVAVDGYRSFYQNMRFGYNYFDLISVEMKNKVCSSLGINILSEKIIGISMGGYGAYYHALKQPNRFNEVISIAGSLHINERHKVKVEQNDFIGQEWRRIFGDELSPDQDLFSYSQKDYPRKNKIYCGFDDHLLEHNKQFVDNLLFKGVQVETCYTEGKHDYDYFINTIIEAINEMKEI